MANVLTATPDAIRGVVRVQGSGVPDGPALVTRKANRVPEPIRGGDLTVSTGGFILEDPEPPYGLPLTYQITSYPSDRLIQTNRVLNPKAAIGTANWTAGTGRTLNREAPPVPAPARDAVTAFRIGTNPTGATPGGITERTLASTVPFGFGTGRWWVTGQVKYDSPDVWTWQTALNNGTWQNLKDEGNWLQVKTGETVDVATPYASLWVAVLSPTNTVVVAPFQILGVQADNNDVWRDFQGWVDVPAGAPANSKLVFLHGTNSREFSTSFWLTTLLVSPEAEVSLESPIYFDGDSAIPDTSGSQLVPGYDWVAVSNDAEMEWSGTPNASTSTYIGPSIITASTTTRIDTPPPTLLPRHRLPILLSDPILPQVSTWFELIEIGDLGFADRQDLYDVVGRGAQIAVSSTRAWADGEFRLMTYTLEQASVAERMFSPGRILFLRNPDVRFPETLWYLAIGKVGQGRVGKSLAWTPERLWSVPFVRVERPVGLIAAASGLTWADIKANYTWDELRTQRSDWLDAAVTPA